MRTLSSSQDPYAIRSPPEIHVGFDVTVELASFIEEHNIASALIVTDPGVRDAGILEPIHAVLSEEAVSVSVYDNVAPEPKLAMVSDAASAITDNDSDLVIGVGGGSSLDVTKFSAVLADSDQPMREMLGMNNVPKAGRPVALLPTTAGTGSEVTHIGVFADDAEGGAKKVVYSPHLFADVALVDPNLTRTLPARVAAETGMDALTHAIEAYVTRLRNPFTDLIAQGSVELICENIRPAVHEGPDDDEARHAMSLAAMLGGQAFVNSGLGAVHALTYPLGMAAKLGHGLANAVLLPYVMAYNVQAEPERYADIARWLGVEPLPGETDGELGFRGVETVFSILEDIDIPTNIAELDGFDQSDFENFADIALEHSKHNIERNPRPMDRSDIIEVFEAAYDGSRSFQFT